MGMRARHPASEKGIDPRWFGMSAGPCTTSSFEVASSAHERSPASFQRFEYAVRRTTAFISATASTSPDRMTARVVGSSSTLIYALSIQIWRCASTRAL